MATDKNTKVPGREAFLGILKEEFGSIRYAAERLDIAPPAIYQWHQVPPKQAIRIEELTAGRIQRSSLRPDYFKRAA